jgi:hypothetical protein
MPFAPLLRLSTIKRRITQVDVSTPVRSGFFKMEFDLSKTPRLPPSPPRSLRDHDKDQPASFKMGAAQESKSSSLRTIPRTLSTFKRIRWFNFTFLILIPLAGLIQALWVPLYWRTLVWSAIYYVLTAGSITTGKSTCDTILQISVDRSAQATTDYGLTDPTPDLRR